MEYSMEPDQILKTVEKGLLKTKKVVVRIEMQIQHKDLEPISLFTSYSMN